MASDEKPTVDRIVPVRKMPFSLTAFKVTSLSLAFNCLTGMSLGVDFFGSVLSEVHSVS